MKRATPEECMRAYERDFAREWRVMVRDVRFQFFNREPVTPARERAYIDRRFDDLARFNRHDEHVLAVVEAYHASRVPS